MIQFLTAYVATMITLALIEILWITNIARPFIFNRVEHLLEMNIPAAILFYMVYTSGILLFAVYPALNASDANVWKLALGMGCLFGFFAYATYDLTNMATLRDWTWSMTLIDIAWGTILTGTAATVGYLSIKLFS